jgi:hypothetical protein
MMCDGLLTQKWFYTDKLRSSDAAVCRWYIQIGMPTTRLQTNSVALHWNATAETPCSQSACFLHLQCCGVPLGYRKTRSVLCKQKTPTVLGLTQYTDFTKAFFTFETSHGSTVQAYCDVIDACVKNTAFRAPGFGCVRLDATSVC